MQIGVACFSDEELKAIVESRRKDGYCDIKQCEARFVYDTVSDDYLVDYFNELLDVFQVADDKIKSTGDYDIGFLGHFLKRWRIFSVSEADTQKIIKAICLERFLKEPELFDNPVIVQKILDKEYMKENCILEVSSWESLSYNLKHKNRFYSRGINQEKFKELLQGIEDLATADSLTLYRSRICDENTYKEGFSKQEMGAPPEKYATAGRTNSEGIKCLYLSDDEDTTLHEVRARNFDRVSIGTFKQVEDLRLVDLRLFNTFSPFGDKGFDMSWYSVNIDFIHKIGDEIAKPMRRFDKTIDYIPTQYVCDYIKSLGYDGIKFKSTLYDKGINYAIFDESKFLCINVKLVEVFQTEYRWNRVTKKIVK